MSLFRRRAVEGRSISFQDVFGSGGDVTLFGSGIEWAQRLIPVYAAQRLIIDKMASTPLIGYREAADGTRTRMARQPQVITSPPFGLTPATWKGQLLASLVGRGNAIGLVLGVGSDGWPTSLYWLNPDEVTCVEPNGFTLDAEFYWRGRRLNVGEFVHIPWIVQPGRVWGLSPLRAFKTAFETGMSAQQSAHDWFVNGAIPSGHLKSTGSLDQSKANEGKAKFRAAVAGRDVLVTGNDWSYTTIGVPADEARFIEMLRLTATQVATIYGIPPEKIGGETAGGSLEYKTLESNQIQLNVDVLHPWAVRTEEAFTLVMPRPQYAKWDLDVHVRADVLTRMQAHLYAEQAGIETADEARRSEDKPPMTDQERAEWLAVFRPAPATPPSTREL